MESSPLEPFYEARPEPPSQGPNRRWFPIWPSVAVLAVLGCAGLSGGVVYANNSADQWQARASQNEEARARTQGELDLSRAEADRLQTNLTKTQGSLSAVTKDYNDATARIRALANEKAQVGDTLAQVQQITALSQQVSSKLDTCINNLRTLQGYVVNLDSYDIDDVIAYATEVNRSCDEAQNLNATLSDVIDQL
ncbi:hypothetical protein [Pedococcus sp. P5_B7]